MIRRREQEPDVLTVLRIQLREQRKMAERELAVIRGLHEAEHTPPAGTPAVPRQRGGSIDPRRPRGTT